MLICERHYIIYNKDIEVENMKKYGLLLSLSVISILSLTSCGTPKEVSFSFPKFDLEVHTELQKGLVDASDPDSYISTHDIELTTFSNSAPEAIRFSWEVKTDNNAKAKAYELQVSESQELDDPWVYTSGGTSIDVYNLKLNTTYYYRVTAIYGGGIFNSEVQSFKTEDSIIRNIYVEGVENVRDLGGYKTEDGKTMKQGLIYRTAQFNYDKSDESAIKSEPTQKGKDTLLKELKIKTDVDVREKSNKQGKDETVGITSSPLGDTVNYQYLPLRFGGSNIYTTDGNQENIKKFFELCADKNNYPIAFHCVRGTDRTGALAWLLEALCGVNEADLYRDYLFSNFANIGGSAIRKKNINGTAFYPYGISIAEGNTMSEKAMNYLIDKVGVSKSTLEAVKNILIEE